MNVRLTVDAITFTIATHDPDLLARWLVERFAEIEFTPATDCRVMISPGWRRNPEPGNPYQPDWVADSRVIGGSVEVRSPAEFVEALQEQLREAEKLAG